MNIKDRSVQYVVILPLSSGRFFCYNIHAGGLYKRYLVSHFTRHFLFGILELFSEKWAMFGSLYAITSPFGVILCLTLTWYNMTY